MIHLVGVLRVERTTEYSSLDLTSRWIFYELQTHYFYPAIATEFSLHEKHVTFVILATQVG